MQNHIESLHEKTVEEEIQKMLEAEVIETEVSDYTSPLIHVEVRRKKLRLWTDYRKLNALTKNHTYPIPYIEERVELVSKVKYISTFYLVRGYCQVPLTEDARGTVAFVSHVGTFLPTVMTFGLKNALFCLPVFWIRCCEG